METAVSRASQLKLGYHLKISVFRSLFLFLINIRFQGVGLLVWPNSQQETIIQVSDSNQKENRTRQPEIMRKTPEMKRKD